MTFGPRGSGNHPSDHEWGDSYLKNRELLIQTDPQLAMFFGQYEGAIMYLYGMAHMEGQLKVLREDHNRELAYQARETEEDADRDL